MTFNESAEEIRAFFAAYFEAYKRPDAEAVVDFFAYPSHITSDSEVVTLLPMRTRQECMSAVDRVLSMHRELGVATGQIRDFSILDLSPRLAQVYLKMDVCDALDQRFYDYEGCYTLAKFQENWRICAISHNQIPRLLACLASRA
jgi:hypothetical protein